MTLNTLFEPFRIYKNVGIYSKVKVNHRCQPHRQLIIAGVVVVVNGDKLIVMSFISRDDLLANFPQQRNNLGDVF
jgi:hypothetical protein